jgi:hypothetical protein
MDYLIFKTLAFAITASIFIWSLMSRSNRKLVKNMYNPKELQDGRYAILKPEDKYMVGIEAERKKDPVFKEK